MVFDLSHNACPYCKELKKIPFKAQPYESCGIREAREEQISDEIIEMFKDRNLSATATINVLTKTLDKVVVLEKELDKAYRGSSPYKRSPS
jgi:glutaredoxin